MPKVWWLSRVAFSEEGNRQASPETAAAMLSFCRSCRPAELDRPEASSQDSSLPSSILLRGCSFGVLGGHALWNRSYPLHVVGSDLGPRSLDLQHGKTVDSGWCGMHLNGTSQKEREMAFLRPQTAGRPEIQGHICIWGLPHNSHEINESQPSNPCARWSRFLNLAGCLMSSRPWGIPCSNHFLLTLPD